MAKKIKIKQKKYSVVYVTKSGRTMVAKNIMASSTGLAKAKLKKQMQKSTSFGGVLMAISSN